jgi:hypothetical protein
MDQTLDEFLTRRLSDLESAEIPLRKALDENLQEQEKVRRAALAAGVSLPTKIAAVGVSISRPVAIGVVQRKMPSLKTIKEAVVAVLGSSLFGLTALEILDQINSLHGMDYPRTSLSPQLSRLKSEGVIEKNGKIWRLASAVAANDKPASLPLQTGLAGLEQEPQAPGGEARPGGGT